MARLSELLTREEVMEKQHSRIEWLQEGDHNTSFFQARSKERVRINWISVLRRDDGSIATTQEALESNALEFYSKLFTRHEVLDPGPVLACVQEKVTPVMNDDLQKPYTTEEVRKALFMMGANKAPGPDGLTVGFYQFHWNILGPGVIAAVLDFLNGGEIPYSINSTTLVLIPKVKTPQEMKQLRPISLCNVIYKICSKVVANRLRVVAEPPNLMSSQEYLSSIRY
jgi:hypothetical protein